MIKDTINTTIETLGDAKILSPLSIDYDESHGFVSDDQRILIDVDKSIMEEAIRTGKVPPSFELAGPRENIFFDPSKLKCGLVTCGGLCPGLNDIIRSIVLELHHRYGATNIMGFRYGLQGLISDYSHEVMDLTPEAVVDIQNKGGSILGSSRGPQDVGSIVDCLDRMNIGILFMIGGDGTLRAANEIAAEIQNRNLKISIIGIPKTIDNDIHLVSRSFGFDTAVDLASQSIRSAHNEALGYPNGIGLIKLMGRHSGFLAATAALAQQEVNYVLIPEVPFDLEGKGGFLKSLEERLERRKHAVIVVAEGAGQKLFENSETRKDQSGNVILNDIGIYIKDRIKEYFADRKIDISMKYIDPSYTIRSLPANANDHIFCGFLGRDAVHAGMAGKTNMIIGHWNSKFVHLPLKSSVGIRKQVKPCGKLWLSVLEATGQGSLVRKD